MIEFIHDVESSSIVPSVSTNSAQRTNASMIPVRSLICKSPSGKTGSVAFFVFSVCNPLYKTGGSMMLSGIGTKLCASNTSCMFSC